MSLVLRIIRKQLVPLIAVALLPVAASAERTEPGAFQAGRADREATVPLSSPRRLPPGEAFPEQSALPPFLQGLDLSDQQEESIFKLLHAQAPAVHAQSKAARAAQQELARLAEADRPDLAAVRKTADVLARASAELSVLRVQNDIRIRALLTPQQREQLKLARRDKSGPRDSPSERMPPPMRDPR